MQEMFSKNTFWKPTSQNTLPTQSQTHQQVQMTTLNSKVTDQPPRPESLSAQVNLCQVPEIARPRPANLTSLPSLLSVFQTEWDALALETFELRKQLLETRQELSTALYQHDAACRVILRLQKERDEAREALSKVSIDGVGMATTAEDMDVDTTNGLPTSVKDKINSFKEEYLFLAL